jgi:hypothetical protein
LQWRLSKSGSQSKAAEFLRDTVDGQLSSNNDDSEPSVLEVMMLSIGVHE